MNEIDEISVPTAKEYIGNKKTTIDIPIDLKRKKDLLGYTWIGIIRRGLGVEDQQAQLQKITLLNTELNATVVRLQRVNRIYEDKLKALEMGRK